MDDRIAARLDTLDARKAALVQRAQALSPQDQAARPSPKAYSPIETVMHLALTERGYVVHMERTLTRDLRGKVSKPSFMFKQILSMLKKGNPIGFSTPEQTPERGVTLEDGIKTWDEVRGEARVVLGGVDDPDSVVFKSFLMGTLDTTDVLDLWDAHMDYHEPRLPSS